MMESRLLKPMKPIDNKREKKMYRINKNVMKLNTTSQESIYLYIYIFENTHIGKY